MIYLQIILAVIIYLGIGILFARRWAVERGEVDIFIAYLAVLFWLPLCIVTVPVLLFAVIHYAVGYLILWRNK